MNFLWKNILCFYTTSPKKKSKNMLSFDTVGQNALGGKIYPFMIGLPFEEN